MTDSLEELIAFCGRNGRVCPQPLKWNELYKLLRSRAKRPRGSRAGPDPPLILAAWHVSSDHQKRVRFISHLQWAHEYGDWDGVVKLVRSLPEDRWHFEGL